MKFSWQIVTILMAVALVVLSFKTVGTAASITPFTETTANTYSAILIPTHDGDVAVTAHSPWNPEGTDDVTAK